jgi:hypothetical protein
VAQIDCLVDVAKISGVLDRAVHLDRFAPDVRDDDDSGASFTSPFSASGTHRLNAIKLPSTVQSFSANRNSLCFARWLPFAISYSTRNSGNFCFGSHD